jgi:hypothetical protein
MRGRSREKETIPIRRQQRSGEPPLWSGLPHGLRNELAELSRKRERAEELTIEDAFDTHFSLEILLVRNTYLVHFSFHVQANHFPHTALCVSPVTFVRPPGQNASLPSDFYGPLNAS